MIKLSFGPQNDVFVEVVGQNAQVFTDAEGENHVGNFHVGSGLTVSSLINAAAVKDELGYIPADVNVTYKQAGNGFVEAVGSLAVTDNMELQLVSKASGKAIA